MSNEDQPKDHVAPEESSDAVAEAEVSEFEKNVKSRSTWLRLVFIIVFLVIYGISRIVVFAVVTFQFFWVLFTGDTNKPLQGFGQSLATYTYQIVRFLTFNTETRPFPLDDQKWPPTTAE